MNLTPAKVTPSWMPGLGHRAEHALDEAADSRAMQVMARLGLMCRGIVHLVIGGYAARLWLGWGGKAVGGQEAVFELGRIGVLPLIVLAVGLSGYGVWRITQALADTEGKGRTLYALVTRSSFAVDGILHAGLVPLAVRLALGQSADVRDPTRNDVAWLMRSSWGRWAVGALGVIVLLSTVSQLIEAVRAKYADDFAQSSLHPVLRMLAIWLGRLGITARAIVFGIFGWFLLSAAWHSYPQEAVGLGEALGSLRHRTFGGLLFAFVSFGILAYAVFCFVYARHRRIRRVQNYA